jgi:hypothetical protein
MFLVKIGGCGMFALVAALSSGLTHAALSGAATAVPGAANDTATAAMSSAPAVADLVIQRVFMAAPHLQGHL